MHYRLLVIAVIFVTACISADPTISEFRGPDRSGIYLEENLMKSWPDDGPEEVFFIDSIGSGFGSPVFADDMMYFTGSIDSSAYLFCFDIDGRNVWEIEMGNEWNSHYPGSRSSPTIAGKLIYVSTGLGNLYCYNRISKKLMWKFDIKNYDGVLPYFGYSESPVIYKDMVFKTVGGEKYNVMALNRFTGETVWSSPGKGERSAYNQPNLIITPDGRPVFVTFTAYHLLGFDALTGELLWSHEQTNYPPEERKPTLGDTHANTVVYDGNAIYYVEGDGNCAVKLDLTSDGSQISEVWRNNRFDSYMGGVVKVGDYLYCGGTRSPSLLSVNASSGVLADSMRLGSGVVIYADNMLYYYSQRGSLHLVEVNKGKMKEISSLRIKKGTKEHFSHPVFYKGVLYLRHGKVVLGYDMKNE